MERRPQTTTRTDSLVPYPTLLRSERIGGKRWIAVAIGFGGAMAIVRPGAGVVHWGAVLVLVMCFTYALYLVTTRMLAATEDAATTLFYSGLEIGRAHV